MNRYCNPPTKATYRSPVYDVRAVPVEKVVANSYNPNVVAPPEMKLLELSIWEDASTIRHNRARGTHNVELMSEIVAELTRAQMSDQWIMRHIGMDRDELLRLKQITGLAELFADKEFSPGDTEDEAVEPARIMR